MNLASWQWSALRIVALFLLATAFSVAQGPRATGAQNKIKAGELVIDPPTLINLGFEWVMEFSSAEHCGGLQWPAASTGRRPTAARSSSPTFPRPRRGRWVDRCRCPQTLGDYSRATHQDEHSVTLDYDTRLRTSTSGSSQAPPQSTAAWHCPILQTATPGRAPDLGALEAGQPLPHYGPRPRIPPQPAT